MNEFKLVDTHDANDANRERSITTSVMSASVDSGVAIHLHNRSFRDHKGSNYDPYSCSQQLAQQVCSVESGTFTHC